MALEAADIAAIINATRDSGGIPVSVNLMATTEWTQYLMMIGITVLGSLFVFIFLWDGYIKPFVGSMVVKLTLRNFKKRTGRDALIIKHTFNGLFAQSMIDITTLNKLETALKKFDGRPFDIILHTPGGQIFYAQILSKIIKNYKSEVRAIIPFYAMSGGTMLALSCNKIVMGDFACLGPVDPQIGSLFSFGSAKSWKEVLKRKGRRANDSSIQMAYIGEQYTKTLRREVATLLSDKITDKDQLNVTAEILTDGQLEHAYQLDRAKLADLGIATEPLDYESQKTLSKIICNNWIEGEFW